MKRVQWLYAIGRREITNKDRVCSVHFRSGRPSSDPSHEDFVPHLFLNREAPPEVLQYLEALAETKADNFWEPDYKASLSMTNNSSTLELNRACRPSILKRKRKAAEISTKKEATQDSGASASTSESQSGPSGLVLDSGSSNGAGAAVNVPPVGTVKRVKLQMLQRPLAEAVGVKPGQTVIIKRRVPVFRNTLQPVRISNEAQGNIPGENIIVAEEQTIQ